ncbi:hypothetical protein AQF52_5071 [Streptomyces venezuelae]|uniref:hypothetical protein n=1 Tax=Streptomyces gardneri TaxID=66892 RepID=UPI0006BDE591|nr:hypothetical protein [Streptomyces gardneri]ALO10665.1 hypothetical protein AQF52_5071 [Streptomyces venezuelae]QPK47647.1 hypothetical protein H4W23_25445 [Streptomyces gardneri]WRK39090.1 hypothetical protein U0M97_25565 [Streptomyces venezuelae]CUM38858.1 hypothetical protein BN2537_6681 [Streptomyces venezuelae]
MSTSETTRFVRLRVDLVLEIDGPAELIEAAEGRIDGDEFMPEEERVQARAAAREDSAEALAYLVEPFDLIREVPGIEMVQASWSTEEVEYDPDALEWDLGEEDGEAEYEEDNEDTDGDGRG